MEDESIYPATFYLFDKKGMYDKGECLVAYNEEELNALMLLTQSHWLVDGLELRVTDPMDMCIFHANKGRIIFPR